MIQGQPEQQGDARNPTLRTRWLGEPTTGLRAADTTAFWRRMVVVRLLSSVAFVVALVVSGLPGRLPLAVLALVGGALGAAWLWRRVTLHGRYPPQAIWVDEMFAVAPVIVVPHLMAFGLIVSIANVGFAVTVLGRKAGQRMVLLAAVVLGVASIRSAERAEWGLYLFGLAAHAAIVLAIAGFENTYKRVHERYDTFTTEMGLVTWEVDDPTKTLMTYVSPNIVDLLGRDHRWYYEHPWADYLHPDDLHVIAYTDEKTNAGLDHWLKYRAVAEDGSIRWLEERVRVEPAADGRGATRWGVMFDATSEHLAEEEAGQWGALVSQLSLPVCVARLRDREDDTSLTVAAANPLACSLVAGRIPELVGKRVAAAFPELVVSGFVAACAEVARTGRSRSIPFALPIVEGDAVRAMTTHLLALPGDGVAMVWIDATDTTAIVASVAREALVDHLTFLPNRRALRRQLRQAIVADGTGDPVTVLLLDLDRFVDVNESLGYECGDALLREVGARLSALVAERGTVYRMGADEFAVVLAGPMAALGPGMAGVIVGSFDTPFDLDGLTVLAGVTIGTARYPQDANDGDTLVQRADMALHRAKRSGAATAAYSPEIDRSSARRVTLIGDLRRAIDAGELVPFYQPVAHLGTGRLVAAEALVRWQHPERGLIMPLEFIEGAEVSGLVGPLTAVLAAQVAADLGAWTTAGHRLSVSINLSARNVHDRHLGVMLADLVTLNRLPPGALCLEITEHTLMKDLPQARAALAELRRRHLEVAIDDFGTGYSSLGMLSSIPLDELKLDKSFIDDLAAGEDRVVRAMIEMAHNLGLRVVAEGVEDADVLARLAQLGCDRGQGWAIARPMPAEPFADLLARAGSAGDWYAKLPDPDVSGAPVHG